MLICDSHPEQTWASGFIDLLLYMKKVRDKAVDNTTGEIKKVHFFVTTVDVSSLIYAEAFEGEKLQHFIAGTVHALEYYGAVPKYLVPDNLRAAITKHTKDELILNSTFQDLEGFDEVIVPPLQHGNQPEKLQLKNMSNTWRLIFWKI